MPLLSMHQQRCSLPSVVASIGVGKSARSQRGYLSAFMGKVISAMGQRSSRHRIDSLPAIPSATSERNRPLTRRLRAGNKPSRATN